jgi:hypothetical protein
VLARWRRADEKATGGERVIRYGRFGDVARHP